RADGADHPVPVGWSPAAGGDRPGDRRVGSRARVADRPAPSAGGARVVHGVARAQSPGPGGPIRAVVPRRLLRPEGVSGADLGAGPRAREPPRGRPRGTAWRSTRAWPPATAGASAARDDLAAPAAAELLSPTGGVPVAPAREVALTHHHQVRHARLDDLLA